MAEKLILAPASREFGLLEYELQLALHATTARITDGYQLSNPHWNVAFEKRAKGLLCLESWVDVTTFLHGRVPASNLVDDEVLKRLNLAGMGFQAEGGMKFSVGQLPLSNDPTGGQSGATGASSQPGIVRKKLMYCKLAIGRAFVCDAQTAAQSNIPSGYDSFHLMSAESSTKNLSYYHEYWIKDAAQVYPMYLVTIEYDPIKEKLSRQVPKCDNCDKIQASVYCQADDAHLCAECDSRLHNANKITQRHQRTPLGYGPDLFGHCRVHSSQKIEFFCAQCHVPVCVHCKMIGNHSTGESVKHKLISLKEALESVRQASQQKDGRLEQRCVQLDQQVRLLNDRQLQIQTMQSSLESQLQECYENALKDLRQRIQLKCRVLIGDQMEVERQKEEIAQLQRFLEYQQTSMDTSPLLFNWSKHQSLRHVLNETRPLREEVDVYADLKVEGRLVIAQDQDAQLRRASLSPPKYKATMSAVNSQMSGSKTPAPFKQPIAAQINRPKTSISQRRTSDFFSETLHALDDIHERTSVYNASNADEQALSGSVFGAGYKA